MSDVGHECGRYRHHPGLRILRADTAHCTCWYLGTDPVRSNTIDTSRTNRTLLVRVCCSPIATTTHFWLQRKRSLLVISRGSKHRNEPIFPHALADAMPDLRPHREQGLRRPAWWRSVGVSPRLSSTPPMSSCAGDNPDCLPAHNGVTGATRPAHARPAWLHENDSSSSTSVMPCGPWEFASGARTILDPFIKPSARVRSCTNHPRRVRMKPITHQPRGVGEGGYSVTDMTRNRYGPYGISGADRADHVIF